MGDGRAVVALLATLDTKSEEAVYVAEQLERLGMDVRVVDLGLRSPRAPIPTAWNRDVVQPSLPSGESKAERMASSAKRASQILTEWVAQGRLAGAMGLGGGQGTWMVTRVFRELPLELPKVLVTTLTSRAGSYLGNADVTVVPSITDIAGLNPILRGVLDRAAGSLGGAIEASENRQTGAQPLVAITTFGITSQGAAYLRDSLRQAGLEVAAFHANGNGGATMETLIRIGRFRGVIDWTTTELADELIGGIASAGPDRLSAAAVAGLPQVIVPGALDVVNFGPITTIPSRFRKRRLYEHTPNATLMRVTPSESFRLGKMLALKLNKSRTSVAVLLPMGGFSSLSEPGEVFYWPEADIALAEGIQRHLASRHKSVKVQAAINSETFAAAVVEQFQELCADRSNDGNCP